MKRKKLVSLLLIGILILTNVIFLLPIKQTFAQSKTKIIIHYAMDPNTDKAWNLWIWPFGQEGKKYEFTKTDDFGPYAVIEFEEKYDKVGFIVRTDNWDKDVAEDRFVEKFNNGTAEIWLLPGDPKIYYSKPSITSNKKTTLGEKTKVTVHYYRYDGNYTGWNLWIWPFGKQGSGYNFSSEDKFGKVATFYVEGTEGVDKIGIITRRSTNDNQWAEKEFGDRFITKFNPDGSAEIWLAQGDEKIHYSPSEIDLSPKLVSATIDDIDLITAEVNIPFTIKNNNNEDISVKINGRKIGIVGVEIDKESMTSENQARRLFIRVSEKLPLDKTITVEKAGYSSLAASYGKVFASPEFDNLYYYDGNDLGVKYTKNNSTFKVWAPTASDAKIVFYSKWDDKNGMEYPMIKQDKGVWSYTFNGNANGIIYTYKVKIGENWNEAVDPYARTVTANGDKGVVVDLSTTNPEKWEPTKKPALNNAVDAIIYELHVRDLSMHPQSGIKNKGKFLGLAEAGTKGPNETLTGLDHIKDLGVTHVQLLPIFDYASVDETSEKPQFNWGYDPKNYNAPEGSYSTNPYDPVSRVKELKTAIQTLHDNNLRVIMDVVYNHMFSADASNFNKIVPGYFFRTGSDGKLTNGSGCGNDTASERSMMRKFIIDSVTYWAKEYNIDGFRFDLMGLHDVETMNQVRKALDKIDPSIIIIGEGWDLNTALSQEEKANQKNAYKMPRIAHFNDTIRDAIKGSVFDHADAGFVNGKEYTEFKVKSGIVGGIEYSGQIYTWGRIEPDQSVVYSEAHDNNTLYDKLKFTNPDATEDQIKAMHKLAGAIVLTSQGIPFIHAGQEFMRTKQGNDNSYNASDEINMLDWERKAANMDVVEYYKGLIKLRKEHPAFRMTTSEMIKKHLQFLDAPKNVIAYTLNDNANGDSWKTIVVAFNGNDSEASIKLPFNGKWAVVVNGEKAGVDVIQTISGNTLKIPSKSSYVLYYKGKSYTIVYTALVIGLLAGVTAVYFSKKK